MKISTFLMPMLRDTPSEAEVISHQLMLRSGMIKKLSSGVFTYLPLGYRVLRKIENIVREEMNRAGAIELHMPVMQPKEIWEESGRWDQMGHLMVRFKDRNQRWFCLGPTHEEVITQIASHHLQSYKQLPVNLYQIQTKFRDEIRPRFGLMRSREFLMKDAYSFDATSKAAKESYENMFQSYTRIFQRCGLGFRAVEAQTGNIGGSLSQEFQVLANSGEDEILSCPSCTYAANVEKAETLFSEEIQKFNFKSRKKKVHTPGVRSVKDGASFLKIPEPKHYKTLFYKAYDKTVCVLVKGDRQINESKLQQVLNCASLMLATEADVIKAVGAPPGSTGPIGFEGEIYADWDIAQMEDAVCGANELEHHFTHVNQGIDFKVTMFCDIKLVKAGDVCGRCGKSPLSSHRGIEVGHIFYLGDKYSKSMKATFLDPSGKPTYFEMGCYGIGVGRTMASAIEQNHDENGIIWPISIAPFEVALAPLNMNDENVSQCAFELYQKLLDQNIEVIFHDKDDRAGVKFKDIDLMGIPIRVTVGSRGLANHTIGIKLRHEKEEKEVSLDQALLEIIKLRDELFKKTHSSA